MIFPARHGGHDDQTQLLNQVLQHVANETELLFFFLFYLFWGFYSFYKYTKTTIQILRA